MNIKEYEHINFILIKLLFFQVNMEVDKEQIRTEMASWL